MTGTETPKDRYTGNVAELLTHGEPEKFAADRRRWPDYIALGLDRSDVQQLIEMAQDLDLNRAPDDSSQVWAPLHAWRSLAQLGATEATCPLLELLAQLDEDDWAQQELPDVFGMFGPSALPDLAEFLADDTRDPIVRSSVVEGIKRVGTYHPGAQSKCTRILAQQLAHHGKQSSELNGCLVGCLLDLDARDEIEIIREAYRAGNVDLSVAGDVEEAELELGFRSERSTPAPGFWLSARSDLPNRPSSPTVQKQRKIGRNELCPCGSGKKYKKCCGG